jgi:hypothetical protein
MTTDPIEEVFAAADPMQDGRVAEELSNVKG